VYISTTQLLVSRNLQANKTVHDNEAKTEGEKANNMFQKNQHSSTMQDVSCILQQPSLLHDAVSVTMTIDHHNSNRYGAITARTCRSVNREDHHSAIIHSMLHCGCSSLSKCFSATENQPCIDLEVITITDKSNK